MKKLLSLILALALTCALAAPAAAAGTADERLSTVTAQVKKMLGLNTDAYTEFYGDLDDDPLSPAWYLEWYGEDGSLSVSATEDGKILNYSRSAMTSASVSNRFAPTFPEGDRESAKAAALAFLDKVLTKGESAVLDEERGAAVRLGATRYRFYGEILINGLSAGLSFSVAVSCADNEVVSFYRDDLGGSILGSVPSSTAKIPVKQASAALRDTLAMRLEYVSVEDGGSRAVLRYLPESGDEYYVDASSGELVNLNELYRKAEGGIFGEMGVTGGTTNESASSDTAAGLSPAEQEGIAKLEGVLDRDTLDSKVQTVLNLKLDGYALSTVSYTVDREEGEDGVTSVTASMVYGRQVGDRVWRRTATVDARTGELLSLYSSARLPEGTERTVDAATARKATETFLACIAPDRFAKTALYSSHDALESESTVSHSFTYAQQENGYFYTDNAIYVGIDSTDGSISSYSKYFDDAVTFDSPEGIISMDAAIDAWMNTYETTLQYILVPAAIDFSQPEYAPLADMGYEYLYKMVLGYKLERGDYLYGIDAKTGEAVGPSGTTGDDTISYSDLTGHWAREKIETLARYGVGFAGGTFQPGKALTQLDLIALLLSTEGYLYQPEEEGSADYLYERAYSMGMLKKEARDDSALLTRAQTVKLILDATGYGHVAQLEGIFRTGFSDDVSIPAAYYGYAALAQGLGVVTGAPGGKFLPNTGATRAEAAVMLYNLMNG